MNPRMSAKEAYHWIGMIEHLQSKCKEFEDKIEELEEEIVDIDSENEVISTVGGHLDDVNPRWPPNLLLKMDIFSKLCLFLTSIIRL